MRERIKKRVKSCSHTFPRLRAKSLHMADIQPSRENLLSLVIVSYPNNGRGMNKHFCVLVAIFFYLVGTCYLFKNMTNNSVSGFIVFKTHNIWPWYPLSHYLKSDEEETAGSRDGVDLKIPSSSTCSHIGIRVNLSRTGSLCTSELFFCCRPKTTWRCIPF